MITYEHEDYLQHYGVIGMKWGVRRAQRMMRTNERLRQKALTYDKRSASLAKKSEKHHQEYDLGRANKKAVKAASYEVKAAKNTKKALKQDNEFDRARYERKAAKQNFKAAKMKIEGDSISKAKGYGAKAMKYSIKSDEVSKKAAKARYKIANNELYIAKMKRKISTLSDEEIQNGYAFVKELQ